MSSTFKLCPTYFSRGSKFFYGPAENSIQELTFMGCAQQKKGDDRGLLLDKLKKEVKFQRARLQENVSKAKRKEPGRETASGNHRTRMCQGEQMAHYLLCCDRIDRAASAQSLTLCSKQQ